MPSKHRLSPAPLPPPKRLHTAGGFHASTLSSTTFESAFYDELLLCVFSHLSWVDLCATQATSRSWARLAADNELWKGIYLRIFGRPRLRGARGFIGRADGREVRSLPGRARHEDYKDWKWMFRISWNWRTGRCSVEHSPFNTNDRMHVLLAGPLTIIAAHRIPTIHLQASSGASHVLSCPSSRRDITANITTLCLDQSSPVSGDIRFAAFLSTGEFTVFNVDHNHPSASTAELTFVPRRPSTIIRASYHHPLMITLSEDFSLSIYDVSSTNVTLTQTLSSFTSYPPASLVLSTPTPSTYKLVVSYAVHVYPHHWTVGATELIISGYEPSVTRSSMLGPVDPPLTVLTSRTIRSIDIPPGFIDERKLLALREQWDRKVLAVADTQTDGKWVVLAPDEPLLPSSSTSSHVASAMYSPMTLQLYRLSLPSAASVASAMPRLTFVRSLHGQTGPVSSLALADGRCVSLGRNGSVWVWDLEAGTGAEVCEPSGNVDGKHALVFDERRIVTAGTDGLVIRRFDV